MPLTTSYFAASKYLDGTKISIARFNHPRMLGGIDQVITAFAPSVELLMDYKNGRADWTEYTWRYTREQREHYKRNREDFDGLLERAEDENIVLLCYERHEGPQTKCHRILLYEMLKKVAEKEGFDVKFIDESPRKP